MHFIEEQWNTAYAWLCKQRCNYPANSDIWHLRFTWKRVKPALEKHLRAGSYQFEPLKSLTKQDGKIIHLWFSRDALVLKLITLHLATLLPVSKLCTHVKFHE